MDVAWTTLIAGAALCLGGWTIYWVGLHLTGALIGAAGGAAAAWVGCQMGGLDPAASLWILGAAGAVGFIAGVFVFRGLHRFAFFFAGAAIGLGAGQAFYEWSVERFVWTSANAGLYRGLLAVGGPIVGGLAMVYGSRWVVAAATSVAGALFVVLSFEDPLVLLAFIPLALTAFMVQAGFLRRFRVGKTREVPAEDEDA